jgi:hypothetical protein
MTNEEFITVFQQADEITLKFGLPLGYTLADVTDTITPVEVAVDGNDVPGLFIVSAIVNNLELAGKQAETLCRDNGSAEWTWR